MAEAAMKKATNTRRLAKTKLAGAVADLEAATRGQAKASKALTVEIKAASDSKTATAQIIVHPPRPAACKIDPATFNLSVGEEAQLVARVCSKSGEQTLWREVSWQSSDPNVASVSESGIVTAVSAGTAVIAAAGFGRKAVARCTVRLMQW